MAVVSPIVIDNVQDTLDTLMDGMNTTLAEALERVKTEPSNTAAMMELQFEMQRWQMGLTTQSNVVKTLGDTVKGVIQNIK